MRDRTRSIPRLALAALLLSACANEPKGLLVPVAALPDVAPANWSAWSSPTPLTEINTGSNEVTETGLRVNEGCPFLTKNGKTLYLASDRADGEGDADLYVSHWDSVAQSWGEPVNLGEQINTSKNDSCAVVLEGGYEMIFFSDRPGGAGLTDLWIATRRDRQNDLGWESPVNLSAVNTVDYEYGHGAYEDKDGSTVLYFTSNRPGALLHDLYMSRRPKGGTFSTPTRVTELSSLTEDRWVRPSENGLEIFFASDREGSLVDLEVPGSPSALDLWSATRERTSDPWGAPVNLGSHVNSEGVDSAPAISWDGRTLIFVSTRPRLLLNRDLYQITRTPGNGPK